jgi:RNA polymerase sigma-54 factor
MRVRAKLEMRQGQSLVMTPQLQQAIKLLQMSNLDLADYVSGELESNPLLEAGGDSDDDVPVPQIDQSPVQERLESLDTDLDNVYADEAPADRQARDMMREQVEGRWATSGGGLDLEGISESQVERAAGREPGLYEILEQQLGETVFDPVERMVGMQLIRMINPAGYLEGHTGELAEQLGVDPALVENCLARIQGFEPSGVGARNLRECLAIQLEEQGHLTLEMEALLDNLPLLAQRDYGRLQKLCGVDRATLQQMVATIRRLDPKPGARFDSPAVPLVVPDVYVRNAADGGWLVELNTESLPKLLVNNQYAAEISRSGLREADRDYVSDCLASANWLVKSLEQRARTILKVAKEIVRQQDMFLAHGVQFLRPLNLRIIADAIGMHESTVSRVTANKYMATPRGIFEMKYFFTSAIASVEGGETFSAESVRSRIKELIDNESPDDILSDDRIVELLRDAGIDIARRTVAKYREALGILSSVQRRREKIASM